MFAQRLHLLDGSYHGLRHPPVVLQGLQQIHWSGWYLLPCSCLISVQLRCLLQTPALMHHPVLLVCTSPLPVVARLCLDRSHCGERGDPQLSEASQLTVSQQAAASSEQSDNH